MTGGAAAAVADVVAQEPLGLEAESLENHDGAGLVDRHLRHQLLKPGAQSQGKYLLRQCPSDPLAAHIRGDHVADFADMRRP